MNRTVLIVEDNVEERQIFSRYFRFVGGNVIEATDGEQGIRAAREHLPDLILMDLSMPIMDGWEAIRQLQEDTSLRRIPVIAITAHHLPRSTLESAGFCGYLEKPLAPFRVLNEVERCLGPIGGSADASTGRGAISTEKVPVWMRAVRDPTPE